MEASNIFEKIQELIRKLYFNWSFNYDLNLIIYADIEIILQLPRFIPAEQIVAAFLYNYYWRLYPEIIFGTYRNHQV